MAITVTIDSVDRTAYAQVANCVIEDRLSGRGTMQLTLVDPSASPSYRPGILETIELADGATTLFGGLITAIEEMPVLPPARGIRSDITAADYNYYADRVLVTETYAAARGDKSLKYIVSDIRTTYLNQFGITLDAGMASGPNLDGEIVFEYVTATAALNHVCSLAGYVWYIDASKVLHAHAPGAVAAPVTLTSANATVRAASWQQDLGQYRNREVVKWNGGVYTADDAGEQAARGLVEHLVEASDITDATSAQTLADGLIRQYAQLPRVAPLTTYEAGFAAGQQGTVTIPERNLSGSWLYQAVTRTYQAVGDTDYRWRLDLEAVEGDELAGSWIDAWRSLLGITGSASSGGSISGGSVAPAPAVLQIIDLGGSRQAGVTGTGANDAIDYRPLYVSSDALSGKTCTIRCQVRTSAAGTSVQPRLWNDSDSTQTGIGSATTSTTWETQSFGVTLVTGKTYHFQLIASNSSARVYGLAVLEAI